jgi:hypothetical protein
MSTAALAALGVLFFSAGCGDDTAANGGDNSTTPTMDAGVDLGSDASNNTSADGGDDDAANADGGDASVGDDGGMVATCTLPEPIVAGTPETDALANSPARCDAQEYQWLRSAELGDVGEFGTAGAFQAVLINTVATVQGIDLPRPAEYDVSIEQYTYTTQDRGQLVDATSLVAYPNNLETDEPVGVVLVLHGTVGFTDQCSPSPTQEQRALAALIATYGYIVVAPDYLGLKGLGDPTGFKHPYLVGEATAIASLDALRALYKMPADKRGNLCASTEYAYFGGSQGGHAALWIDRLAPYYARELTPLGGVATVPPADLLTQMERALQTPVDATGNTIAFLGASADWYGKEGELDEVFVPPLDVDIPAAIASSCDPGDEVTIDPQNLGDVFTPEILAAAANGTIEDFGFAGCMTEENTLETTSIARIPSDLPSYGILNVFGEADDLVNTPIERAAYERLCNGGMPYEYLECAVAGHVDATFWAFEEILDFLEARLAKEPFTQGACEVSAPVRCSGTP